MSQTIDLCDSPPGSIVNGSFSGTKLIALSLTLCIESILLSYLISQLWCTKCTLNIHRKHGKLSTKIRCIVTVYHLSFMLWLVILSTLYSIPIFSQTTYDVSSLPACIISTNIVLIPFTSIYVCCALFWFVRLKGVFQRSKYQISRTLNMFILLWINMGAFCSVVCLSCGLVITIIAILNNNSNEIFCLQSKQVLDFFVYVHDMYDNENNKITYQYKLSNWHVCSLKPNSLVFYLSLGNNIIGAMSVPTVNAILFYQFVSKMKQHARDMSLSQTKIIKIDKKSQQIKDVSSNYNQQVYLNGIIGIISVLTTILSLILYIVDETLFSFLFFVDLIINGILMIMVLNFGHWLICNCCHKLIDKLINIFQNTSNGGINANSNSV